MTSGAGTLVGSSAAARCAQVADAAVANATNTRAVDRGILHRLGTRGPYRISRRCGAETAGKRRIFAVNRLRYTRPANLLPKCRFELHFDQSGLVPDEENDAELRLFLPEPIDLVRNVFLELRSAVEITHLADYGRRGADREEEVLFADDSVPRLRNERLSPLAASAEPRGRHPPSPSKVVVVRSPREALLAGDLGLRAAGRRAGGRLPGHVHRRGGDPGALARWISTSEPAKPEPEPGLFRGRTVSFAARSAPSVPQKPEETLAQAGVSWASYGLTPPRAPSTPAPGFVDRARSGVCRRRRRPRRRGR